ncbi:hypothetical protein NECAME_09716 [Necator americanus]|uniref:Thyrotropin-releasing hormone receptor n=1 Tax=Necator americanus TaxID=51031 RepID=W2TC48_NECAM|nr:hypothetical protein NECAME_09716 [Necator americanus]ETN79630.1 hypothetical protein NECAME_09716 [Necator americanus]
MPTFLSEQLRSLCPSLEFDSNSEWILLPGIGFFPSLPSFTSFWMCSELPAECQVPTEQAEWVKYCVAFMFASLAVIGIVGNILVITVVLKVRGMKTPTNCYLLSLAVSDTLFFIATTPTELSSLFTVDYPFGSICESTKLFTFALGSETYENL